MPKVFETENALGVVPNPATNPDGRPFVIDAFGGYAGSFGGDTGIKDVTVYPTEDAFFHRFPWFQDRDSWNPKPPAPPQTPPSGVKGIGNKIFY